MRSTENGQGKQEYVAGRRGRCRRKFTTSGLSDLLRVYLPYQVAYTMTLAVKVLSFSSSFIALSPYLYRLKTFTNNLVTNVLTAHVYIAKKVLNQTHRMQACVFVGVRSRHPLQHAQTCSYRSHQPLPLPLSAALTSFNHSTLNLDRQVMNLGKKKRRIIFQVLRWVLSLIYHLEDGYRIGQMRGTR